MANYAGEGAAYGSVIPGAGTALGALAGSFFGRSSAPTGGKSQGADELAYLNQDFQDLFGRAPTAVEQASLLPAYSGAEPLIPNKAGGKAAVAQYFNATENTPEKQYARQQKEYEAKAPEYYDAINQQFQSGLGRDATDAEKKHFGSLLASGQVDDYTVGQFISTLPEAVQKQDEAFRNNLNTTLQKQNAQYFNEQIMPGIQSAFANQGRDVRSSGFSNSIAQAAQQQNLQREGFLSNLIASQYGNSQALAQNAYQQAYGNYQGLQDYSRQRSAQLQDASQNRINELSDYATQKSAYDQYLRNYGKRKSGTGIGSLVGGALGAGVGALGAGLATGGLGAGQGAMIGYSLGSGLGGGVGSMF